MINPLRSEAEAFRFLIASIVYFGAIVVASVVDRHLGRARRVHRADGWRGRLVAACPARGAPEEDRAPPSCGRRAAHPRDRERDGRRLCAPLGDPGEEPRRPRGGPRRHARPELAATALGLGRRRSTRRSPGTTRHQPRPACGSRRAGAAARSATATRSRRWRTRCGRSARTRSSSRRTRKGARTGSSAASSRRHASVSRSRSHTWSSISNAKNRLSGSERTRSVQQQLRAAKEGQRLAALVRDHRVPHLRRAPAVHQSRLASERPLAPPCRESSSSDSIVVKPLAPAGRFAMQP